MEDFQTRTKDIVSWLQNEYTGIRTGQATPALLDVVKVESYGTRMQLNQVASVGVEDARTLRISPYDAGQIGAIETAIRDADLGVSVATDSAGLRVLFPELTAERRTQMLKLAKSKLEDARVSLRSVRDDAMKDIDAQQKSGDISEDEKFSQKEAIQKVVDATNGSLDGLYAKKETELQK